MKRFASMALIPLFAGFLCGQIQAGQSETQTTTTTTTTLNGTLVDAGCYTTRTEHKETTSTTPQDERGASTSTRTESTKKTVECPVTVTTTTFGLLTPEGRYVRFDEPSNTRIVEIVKGNKVWTREITDRAPIKVQVKGKHRGDVVVMESIR
jgi:hypothetical protein